MKTNWFLSLLVLSAALLTGCADAELTNYPQIHVALQMSLVDDSPHYEVMVENASGISIQEVGIVQRYQDNNNVSQERNRSRTDILKVQAFEPITYTDESLNAYANDVITACAFIRTELGTFRSDDQTLVVPGTGVIQIDSARFDFDEPTGNKGTLRIFGSNFSTSGGAISISGTEGLDTSGARLKCYHDSIVASGVKCNAYGTLKANLRQYAGSYPLDVYVEGLLIDSIVPLQSKVGEPLTIYISHATPGVNYTAYPGFHSYSTYSRVLDQDEHHISLLPVPYRSQSLSQASGPIVVKDPRRDITIISNDSIVITRDPWSSWGNSASNHNCRVGDRLCSYIDGLFASFNLEKHRTDIWKNVNAAGPDNSVDTRMFGIGGRYAYALYYYLTLWTPDSAFLSRYDLVESKWENLTAHKPVLRNAWFEDDNTFRGISGTTLYTYHPDTDTWDAPSSTRESRNEQGIRLTEECQFCGTYKDYVYLALDGSVYRYPVGDPTDIRFVNRPKIPLTVPYQIYNDTFTYGYHENDGIGYFLYVYQMPMSSLLEGTDEVTCVGSPEDVPAFLYSHYYETSDYHVITINGEIKYLKK